MLSYDGCTFEFNDETAESHNIKLKTRPNIPVGAESVEFITVAGRETPVTVKQGTYDNIQITVECGFRVSLPKDWPIVVRDVRQWLRGSGRLTFTDSSDCFYKVKDIEIGEISRTGRNYGEFDVVFTCEPFEYLWSGIKSYNRTSVLNNPYDVCHPIYKIEGSGAFKLTVNGKTMSATVSENMTIDTELMMAYKSDGTNVNTDVTGDYEDLWLVSGQNTISGKSGFTMSIIPNWRYL